MQVEDTIAYTIVVLLLLGLEMKKRVCDPCSSLGDICGVAEECLDNSDEVCAANGTITGDVTVKCIPPCHQYDPDVDRADYLCDEQSQSCYVEGVGEDDATGSCR